MHWYWGNQCSSQANTSRCASTRSTVASWWIAFWRKPHEALDCRFRVVAFRPPPKFGTLQGATYAWRVPSWPWIRIDTSQQSSQPPTCITLNVHTISPCSIDSSYNLITQQPPWSISRTYLRLARWRNVCCCSRGISASWCKCFTSDLPFGIGIGIVAGDIVAQAGYSH